MIFVLLTEVHSMTLPLHNIGPSNVNRRRLGFVSYHSLVLGTGREPAADKMAVEDKEIMLPSRA